MRTPLLLLSAALYTVAFAQTTVTMTTGAGNAQQTWYKLTDDAHTTAPLAEWDLAFEINGGFNVGIRANTQKGLGLYQAPYAVADWAAVDTNGLAASWAVLFDSDTDWSTGAFNRDADPDAFNLGWGIYNMVTHVVAGDSIYVVHLTNGDWKKLRIDALAGGVYTFTYADLDGSAEHTGTIAKSAYEGKNFAYWSFATDSALDREVASEAWDLLFTKYVTDLGIPYGVTGVLHNKGVEVVQVNGLPPAEAEIGGVPFEPAINTIGYDWKSFNMATFQYVVDDSLTYFVKDVPGNLWKVVFAAFGGSSTGDVTFTKEQVGTAGIQDGTVAGAGFQLYPNPAGQGAVQLVIDAAAADALVSITDLGGRLVRQQRLTGLAGLTTRTVELESIPAGLYAVRVDMAGASVVRKLIVE